jgi:hypothetical protein
MTNPIICFFEPIRGAGRERRDELGNFASYRKQRHLGEDWGFTNGSADKSIFAIHEGTVTDVYWSDALGWSVVIGLPDNCNCGFGKESIEFNHMIRKPDIKVGDKVKGNFQSQIGNIGATGSSLSASGANHLHASMGEAKRPHTLPFDKKRAMFPLIDQSSKNRKAAMEAKKAK